MYKLVPSMAMDSAQCAYTACPAAYPAFRECQADIANAADSGHMARWLEHVVQYASASGS